MVTSIVRDERELEELKRGFLKEGKGRLSIGGGGGIHFEELSYVDEELDGGGREKADKERLRRHLQDLVDLDIGIQ